MINTFFHLVQTALLLLVAFLIVTGCSSLAPSRGRVFLDSSTYSDSPPRWVSNLKTTWEEDKKVFLRASQTVRGDERVGGCFDLASLDAKEKILSELANEVRGSLDNAVDSISEEAEVILGKVRSGEFSGRITGLRFAEQYFERYLIGDTERVDCHVLAEISHSDYSAMKREVVNKLAKADPRIREAITNKQAQFFHNPQE